MAGIYIHIPFCFSKCNYCDFYSIPNTIFVDAFLTSLITEINLRKNYLENELIATIYFGGGTPSLLSINQINKIIEEIYLNFRVCDKPEITLEANPDDLSIEFLSALKSETKINRLSVGIQSFLDDDLKLMNRRHNAQQAFDNVLIAKKAGFDNISIDLIYGLPNQTTEKWITNIDKALGLNIQHISAYHLTYERKTNFYKFLKSKKIEEVDENLSVDLFTILIDKTKSHNFEHYEISNFALPNYYSKHNTSYWFQKKYLGIGPSAHSYNLESRQWNVSDVQKYISALAQNKLSAKTEKIDITTKYNEYIMTSLRTMWGVNLEYIQTNFPEKFIINFKKLAKKYISSKHLIQSQNNLILSEEGIFISNSIISELFFV